jgi:hypothetical protein
VNAIAAAAISVGEFIRRDARLERLALESAVSLLLGEEIAAVGNDEAEIAGARLVYSWKLHFV